MNGWGCLGLAVIGVIGLVVTGIQILGGIMGTLMGPLAMAFLILGVICIILHSSTGSAYVGVPLLLLGIVITTVYIVHCVHTGQVIDLPKFFLDIRH